MKGLKVVKLGRVLAVLLMLVGAGAQAQEQEGVKWTWKPLGKDGLHDPTNPGIVELQDPGEVFADFPKDYPMIGNQVDWVRALEQGYINPRTNIFPETEIEVLDLDIIMDQTASMGMVRFPHRAHTQWLDCENCHDQLFVAESGANPVNMFAILSGEFCGRCHGAVAFPLTECNRCHSVARSSFTGKPGPQPEPGFVFPPRFDPRNLPSKPAAAGGKR